MTDIGRAGIVMKGDYNSASTYETLDAVSYQNGLYIAKQNVPAGTAPTNTTYWQCAISPNGLAKVYRSSWVSQLDSYTFTDIDTHNCLVILFGYDSYSQGAILLQKSVNGQISSTVISNYDSLHFSATFDSNGILCTCDNDAQGVFCVISLD